MFAVCGSEQFLRIPMWILDLFVVVILMFRLYWCYAALGSASCYDVGGVDLVCMKLFVVRSCYLCVLFMCQTRECRPNEGAP